MAHQRQQRKGDEIESNHRHPEHLVAADQAHRERRHRERNKSDDIAMRDPRSFAEHGDEGEQVDRQREHPQERRRGDIGRQVRRDRDDEAGRHRGKHNPAHPFNATRSNFILRNRLCATAGAARGVNKPAILSSTANSANPEGPESGLRLQRQERLDDDGIGEQSGKRAEIGRGVEHVGIGRLPVPARGKPRLQQGRAGRQRKEREPDRYRKQSEQPERRPIRWWSDPSRRDRDRQHHRRDPDQQQMKHRSPARPQRAVQQMRVRITCQQHRLKEHHRDRPHGRRTAEFRQYHLRKHRLDREQQQGRDE